MERQEVALASRLVRMSTTAQGNEEAALGLLADILADAGFTCSLVGYDPHRSDRQSLVARLCPTDSMPSLYLGGHIDTVPYDESAWKSHPLSGHVRDGRLYGRGSCDMKGGVAAMVCACAHMAPRLAGRDMVLHVYGGEERGCLGSLDIAARPDLFGNAAAGIVAEPSGLLAQVGHKGALWMELRARGRAVHASMPEEGDNALTKLLLAGRALCDYKPGASHQWLGSSTFALTTLHAGINPNSIPDRAVLTLDMRTVPGQDHAGLLAEIQELAGSDVQLSMTYDGLPVWTDPSQSWCAGALTRASQISGRPATVSCAKFFTDAASVRRLFPDLPLLILGPGYPEAAHVNDEYCPVEQIVTARRIYEALMEDWYLPEDDAAGGSIR
ncbi:MAG: M20 family metallopeptidase [Desulfovibrio sp.]|jgi:succinyl-diaminopimelate desuccinylase|nr:M20 family metallopeptidase [Desulfovibrio sp.]